MIESEYYSTHGQCAEEVDRHSWDSIKLNYLLFSFFWSIKMMQTIFVSLIHSGGFELVTMFCLLLTVCFLDLMAMEVGMFSYLTTFLINKLQINCVWSHLKFLLFINCLLSNWLMVILSKKQTYQGSTNIWHKAIPKWKLWINCLSHGYIFNYKFFNSGTFSQRDSKCTYGLCEFSICNVLSFSKVGRCFIFV